MKQLPEFAVRGLIALSLVSQGVVAAAATPPSLPDDTSSCRKVMSGKDTQGQVFCGTAGQWAEFDRRVALVNAGVTCRGVHSPTELCMTAAQWKQYDRRQRTMAMGNITQGEARGSSLGDVYAGAAREQMDVNLQSHMQALVPPSMPSN